MESIHTLHQFELSHSAAAKVKAAAAEGAHAATTGGAAPAPALVPGEHPGVERWPVKTGTDADASSVGQNNVKGENLGAGVVTTTVEELIALPRPANMPPLNSSFPENSFYQNHRAAPAETTVWKI